MAQDLGKQIKSVFNQLVEDRKPMETIWRDAYRYTFPHRGQYFISQNTDGIQNAVNANNDQSSIFDSTAADSVTLLASSIMSGLTPSASQWFQFRLPNVKFDNLPYTTRDWMESTGKILFSMIHTGSNYNAIAIECLEEMAIAGMFAMYITKEEGQAFHFELWNLDTLYVIENPKTGLIDTVYRLHQLTATQAVENFGIDNVPESIRNEYNNKPDSTKMFEFIHCIKPRKDAKGKLSKDLPYGSYYVCKQSGMLVKESGYNELPVVIPRWSKLPRTSYAVGPINKALPDIKTLNKVVEMMLMNEEMAINGTYVAKADGMLNPNSIRIGARRVIFATDPANIVPLASGGDFRIAFEEITRLQRQIKSVMMADELEPIQKNYASATEVTTRTQIVRQILGPTFSRLHNEFLEVMLNRCFWLALRDGSLPPIPQELQGFEIIPEYISAMARAQKMEEVTAMLQFEQQLGALAQLKPEVLDVYDFDSAVLRKAYLLGVPADVLRSKDQLRRVRSDRAEQQAAEQQAAQQQQVMSDPQMMKVGLDAAGGAEGLQQMMEQASQ